MEQRMQFKVLGPLEVIDATGRSIELGGAQSRAVLAMLLVTLDRVVPLDSIVERLWPDGPPSSATSTLQSYISRLRRALERAAGDGAGAGLLTWESTGYRLHASADIVDFARFETGADRGRQLLEQGETAAARDELADALALWRGPALQEFADVPWARGVATRLDERRLAVLEDRIRADLLLGRHEVLIGELSGLIDEHPLREGFWEHLAVALYRSGRQAEALRALDDLRNRLVDNLGVDPSPRIRELESQILGHDPALAAPATTPSSRDAGVTPPTTAADPDGRFVTRTSRHFSGIFTTEMVGRESERRALTGALASALTGRTHWVLIEGEPGIGKTRLMEFLAEEAHHQGFQVLWGRSYESGATPAFWPWLGALRGITDPAHPLPGAMQEMIDRLLSSEGDATLDPVDAGRYRLFEAISLLIERAAERVPARRSGAGGRHHQAARARPERRRGPCDRCAVASPHRAAHRVARRQPRRVGRAGAPGDR
ncbi:MAG: AAA family ATPase [Actinobacteria bacterium]|nr:AAA family ATPase [Actinomycetota bacterium]